MVLVTAAARTFRRLVAFATCGEKPRKRKIGSDTAEPLLAKVLINPAARPPMKSNRCWVIPPPALSLRYRPSAMRAHAQLLSIGHLRIRGHLLERGSTMLMSPPEVNRAYTSWGTCSNCSGHKRRRRSLKAESGRSVVR